MQSLSWKEVAVLEERGGREEEGRKENVGQN